MMILLPNMMQSMFIFGFNVRLLYVRAKRAISTGGIGLALANDVEGTMLFKAGVPTCCNCALDPIDSDFVLDFDPSIIISNSGRFSSFLKTISSISLQEHTATMRSDSDAVKLRITKT
jgi:hypothetical protein